MRFALLSDALAGRELAVPIYNDNGMIFVNKGVILTEKYIKSIRKIGVSTIYVEDGNEETSLQEVLNSGIKLRLAKVLKNEFEKVKKNKVIDENQIKNIVTEIIREIDLSENAFLYNNVGQADAIMKLALHSLNVAILAILVGVNKKYDEKKLFNLGIGALLHDIGKLISEGINHPELGYKYIKENTMLPPTATICILQHHENNNGSGYPNKISGDKIFEFSSIVSICDEYLNIQVNSQLLPYQAMERIVAETPYKFKIEIYKDFSESIYCYPNGLTVKLNNNQEGIVVMQNKNLPSRPIVMVLKDSGNEYIDLTNNLTLFIDQVKL